MKRFEYKKLEEKYTEGGKKRKKGEGIIKRAEKVNTENSTNLYKGDDKITALLSKMKKPPISLKPHFNLTH